MSGTASASAESVWLFWLPTKQHGFIILFEVLDLGTEVTLDGLPVGGVGLWFVCGSVVGLM